MYLKGTATCGAGCVYTAHVAAKPQDPAGLEECLQRASLQCLWQAFLPHLQASGGYQRQQGIQKRLKEGPAE